MERMHYYWGFMSIHSSKFGKEASLLWLERMHHYCGFMSIHSSKMERMHHYWGFMSIPPVSM